MIIGDGCWAEFRTAKNRTEGRPCLFLDRDGVLIEDTGYPHRPDEVVLIPSVIDLARVARDGGYVVGVVSNQSGIGRGLFGWSAFSAVQGVIDDALRHVGAALDFVLACPHHPEAAVPRYRGDHPWRKPAPGMIVAATDWLKLDLTGSVMIGDKPSDMASAVAAKVPHRWLLSGGGDTATASLDATSVFGRDRIHDAFRALAHHSF